MIKAGIFGCDGYTGEILISLLSGRDDITIVHAFTGKEIRTLKKMLNDIDVAFLALPPEVSMKIAPQLLGRIKVIDLSGAFRLKNVHIYKKYYKHKHLYPHLLKKAVYGLPERNRFIIKGADFIANPGCYATAVILGMLPLLTIHMLTTEDTISVKAVSGYTGAGKDVVIPKDKKPYEGGRNHRHIPEIEEALNLQNHFMFYPSVAPWKRGIEVNIELKYVKVPSDILKLYKRCYRKDKFVRVKDKDVKIEDVVGTNFCHIYPRVEKSDVRIKVVIDNLIKGAAGQAIQNMNIMFGLSEETSLL